MTYEYIRARKPQVVPIVSFHPNPFPMKKSLLALALFAFVGTTAFGSDGHDKDGKKSKKECAKGMAGGSSCCMMKDTKTAAVKPEVKPSATVKL